ncbi:MAG: tRNA (N(6)-L-threonylcarbamoyladenosine(37)-C(2))-methylthiotransferase MtaB [Proteobacteria bacterium]|nr:tRNA (N(6)-L-threonylcarbamoyladenosine(37)-C(2))-methylthiotransferase MtaB [Pseudomonadota bacterium]
MGQDVITFGCRLNSFESEVIKKHLEENGLTDVAVFNTCAVTKEAERQARQSIRRYRRENPDAKIIVTGCSAQVNPKAYADMPEVDNVIGNAEKLKGEAYQNLTNTNTPSAPDFIGTTEKIQVNDIMSVEETAGHLIPGLEGRTRAFLQVQNGCDHRCTFCIIPYGRGNSRSVPIGHIVEQATTLVKNGYQEIVLTGVDLTSYGADLPGKPTLGQMVRRLLALVPNLPRIRLSSVDVAEIDQDLFRLIADEPRLMPHFHLSLQAGDDMILKRMKRRHTRKQALDFVHNVRKVRPDAVFGADIIAGFPTETDEMFQNTFEFVRAANLIYLHVFPYSEREGTPAAKIPADKQVPLSVRKNRARLLRKLGEKQLNDYQQSQVNRTVKALIEHGDRARTEHYTTIQLSRPSNQIGHIVDVTITGYENGNLTGSVALDAAEKSAA